MTQSTHKVIHLAETQLNASGVSEFLKELGAPEWSSVEPKSDADLLVEIAGRLCYKSFNTELNPNITRVREGNQEYVKNILKQKHGSVLEHASVTFAFLNVSRIFTHEIVRHRAGMAFSQESQRFVRLDTFEVYIPDLTDALEELYDSQYTDSTASAKQTWVNQAQQDFIASVEHVSEQAQTALRDLIAGWGLDNEGVTFSVKKKLTSALRRLVPGGVNTHIIVTGNHRAWRHVIENRTAPGAEQEIRDVFYDVGKQLKMRYPAIYQDMGRIEDGCWQFVNSKV